MEIFQFIQEKPKHFFEIKNQYHKNNKLDKIPNDSYAINSLMEYF